jgi:hypothetical protein
MKKQNFNELFASVEALSLTELLDIDAGGGYGGNPGGHNKHKHHGGVSAKCVEGTAGGIATGLGTGILVATAATGPAGWLIAGAVLLTIGGGLTGAAASC